MSERRFAGFTVEALEKLFDENRKVLPTIESIGAELKFRKTKRAKDLELRVGQAIAVFGSTPMPDEEEPWFTYEQGLTHAERALIIDSPVRADHPKPDAMPLLEHSRLLARASEHMLLAEIVESLESAGLAFVHNAEGYGLAMRLAAFEIRNGNVSRWPAFALLFRKLLGEKAVPWLPSLYLGAMALEPGRDIGEELQDVLAFRDQFAKGM